jgi:hypothetical protein
MSETEGKGSDRFEGIDRAIEVLKQHVGEEPEPYKPPRKARFFPINFSCKFTPVCWSLDQLESNTKMIMWCCVAYTGLTLLMIFVGLVIGAALGLRSANGLFGLVIPVLALTTLLMLLAGGQRQVVLNLRRLSRAAAAMSQLGALLEHQDEGVRRAAAEALKNMQGVEGTATPAS